MALRLCPKVCTTETEYGIVILDQHSGDYFQLNPTGTLVLRTLLDGGGESDAVQAVLAEFEVDRAEAIRDVVALIEQFQSSGLMQE